MSIGKRPKGKAQQARWRNKLKAIYKKEREKPVPVPTKVETNNLTDALPEPVKTEAKQASDLDLLDELI